MGVTKGKSGTLINMLCEFKQLFDTAAPLTEALSDLVAAHPERYGNTTLRGLCDEMRGWKKKEDRLRYPHDSFVGRPKQRMSPAEARRLPVRGEARQLRLDDLDVTAVGVVPHPPGIPMWPPGEAYDTDIVEYLKTLEAFDKAFPGFRSFQPHARDLFDVVASDTDTGTPLPRVAERPAGFQGRERRRAGDDALSRLGVLQRFQRGLRHRRGRLTRS